jgi:nucleotidyltransferase/DNA polymerase involved in DNA repair
MERLPIRKIPGVGKINEQILSGMGIKKCRDTLKRSTEI